MKRTVCTALGLIVAGMIAGASLARGAIDIPASYVDGRTYGAFDETVRFGYVNGVSDGIKFGFTLGRDGTAGHWFDCAAGWSSRQAGQFFETYLRAHPDRASMPAAALFWIAANGVCTG